MDSKSQAQLELEKLYSRVKELKKARQIINKSQNNVLKGFLSRLEGEEKQLESSIAYHKQKLEGPWLDSMGSIERGKYEGLRLRDLLIAMANSAWDYPTAARRIAKSVEDPKMLNEMEFTFYPADDPKSIKAYGYFMEMAPEEDFEPLESVFWDT